MSENLGDVFQPKRIEEIEKELGMDLRNEDPNELLKRGIANRMEFLVNYAINRDADLLWMDADYNSLFTINRAEDGYVWYTKVWEIRRGRMEVHNYVRDIDSFHLMSFDEEMLNGLIRSVEQLKGYYGKNKNE